MEKITLKNMTMKQKKKLQSIVRAVIQITFFLLAPSAFTASFAGVKYIFTQLGMKETIEMTSFVAALIGLCVYTFFFGRFFCGYACAFGAFGDAVHAIYMSICKKCKKKPIKMKPETGNKLNNLKYVVLVIIVLLCYTGIYSRTQGYSPWDVFSMVCAGNFRLEKYIVGIVLFLFIIIGMCVQERFFCRFLCPMGAVFAMLPVLPIYSLFRNREKCLKGCSGCTRNCPVHLTLLEEGSMDVTGECIQCQKCISFCPKSNIHCGIGTWKGNEIWFTILRALLLFFLLLWIGI